MSEKFRDLFILAAKENARNRRAALYNQSTTLDQLVAFENRAFLNLVGHTFEMLRILDEKRKIAT